MKKIAIAVAAYLAASALISAAYSLFPDRAWDIASHRNGLTIIDADERGIYMLPPWNNYGDDWYQVGGFNWEAEYESDELSRSIEELTYAISVLEWQINMLEGQL